MALTQEQLDELRKAPVGAPGNRVQAALDLLKVTQTAAGEAMGLKTSYVSDVARGRWDTVTVENAHKFSEFIGCAIEDIFPARDAVQAIDDGFHTAQSHSSFTGRQR